MTVSISLLTSSGIVLTADSRQTYTNNAGMTRIGTDSAFKLFQLNNKVGVVTAGRAFFPDEKGVFKNTGWFIEEFSKAVLKNYPWSVKQIAEELNTYFMNKLLDPEEIRIKELLKQQIESHGGTELLFNPRDKLTLTYEFKNKDGVIEKKDFFIETVHFIVAGYDEDGIGRAYLTSVPDGPSIERNTENGGVLWIGQTEIIVRILKGFGLEIYSLDFVKDAQNKNNKEVEEQLNKLEYIINWGTMTLQDAVDFNVLMTKLTESIQRFSDGTVMNPGGITGVGGHINVAIITPQEGFHWINKKEVIVENS